MIIKWETGGYYGKGNYILRIECTRETENCVWTLDDWKKERRRDKVSSFGRLHDTWDNAHRHLVEKAEQEESALCKRLGRIRDELEMLSRMEKPHD